MVSKIYRSTFLYCIAYLVFAQVGFGQFKTTTWQGSSPNYPLWSYYVPGATHFIDGKIGTGLAFTALELGGITAGIVYNKDLQQDNNSPYYNYPLYAGLNGMAVDKCHFVHRQMQLIGEQVPDLRYDDTDYNDLLKAPFRLKNIVSPIALGFVALAGVELWAEKRVAEISYDRVADFRFFDRYLHKDKALPFYGAVSMLMSWEAGVAEEYIFRNYLQSLLDYRFGQRKGLLITSAAFGLAHAFNYIFVPAPDPFTILYHVGFTSVLGYVLGRSVQKNDYRIGRAVAAHTWYNFTLMLGSFVANPQGNVFGIGFRVKL